MIGMAKTSQRKSKGGASSSQDLSPSKVLAIVANWNNSPVSSPKRTGTKRPRDKQLSASVPSSRRQRKSFRKECLSSTSDEDETPSFRAKAFYTSAKSTTRYLSPLERREERDRLIDAGIDPTTLNQSFEDLQKGRVWGPSHVPETRPDAKTLKGKKENGVSREKTLISTSKVKTMVGKKPQGYNDTISRKVDGGGKDSRVLGKQVQSPAAGQMSSGVKGEIKVTLSERALPPTRTKDEKPAAESKDEMQSQRRASPRKLGQGQGRGKTASPTPNLTPRRTSPRKSGGKTSAGKGIQMYVKNLRDAQKKGKKSGSQQKPKDKVTAKTNNAKDLKPKAQKLPSPTKTPKELKKTSPAKTLKTPKEDHPSQGDGCSSNEKAARGLDFGGSRQVNGQDVALLEQSFDEPNVHAGKQSDMQQELMDFLVFNDEDFNDDGRETEDFVQNLLMEIDDDLEETENVLKRSPRKRKMKTEKECIASSPSPAAKSSRRGTPQKGTPARGTPKRGTPNRSTPSRKRMSSTPMSSKKSSQPRLDDWLTKIGSTVVAPVSPREKARVQRSEVKGHMILTPEASDTSSPKDPTSTGTTTSPSRSVKLYPVFTPPTSPGARKGSPAGRKKQGIVGKVNKSPQQARRSPIVKTLKTKGESLEQATLDLGQKRYGAVTCQTCGTVFTAAHPEDEADHARFHKKYLSSIKFPGWKQEEMVEEFHDGRILVVTHDAPYFAEKKVGEIRELVDRELGFTEGSASAAKDLCKTYLFITTDKKVGGCVIAEQISKGYRVIVDDHRGEAHENESQRAWCCETDSEPALCGISRIWVPLTTRRQGIATRLMDCVRKNFMFGTILSPDNVAFSDPTPDGKAFATKYTGTPRFLVYKYH